MAVPRNTSFQGDFVNHFFSFLIGLSFLFGAVFGSSAKYCFFRDNNSQETLLNQTCETGDTTEAHLAQTIGIYQHDHLSDLSKPSHNHTPPSPDGGNCYIFRHLTTEYLPPGLKKESISIQFGCDFATTCFDKEADTVLHNMKYGNGDHVGQLYCCSTDNCNSISKLPHSPAENRLCYSGLSNNTKVNLESCGHPDVYCVKVTYFYPEGKLETFACDKHDNRQQCDTSSANGAYRFCDNRTVGGVVQELCCCDGNRCNQPSNPNLVAPETESSDKPSGDKFKGEIKHPIKNPQEQDKSDKLITGLVAAVVILVFAGISIILFTAYKKSKQRNAMRRDPNVIMQYERLSASEPDVEDAVVV